MKHVNNLPYPVEKQRRYRFRQKTWKSSSIQIHNGYNYSRDKMNDENFPTYNLFFRE